VTNTEIAAALFVCVSTSCGRRSPKLALMATPSFVGSDPTPSHLGDGFLRAISLSDERAGADRSER
jgi:hypothetical protein